VALEDVVVALAADSADSDLERAAVAEVSRTYILPPGEEALPQSAHLVS
jgi:hypothetical protein